MATSGRLGSLENVCVKLHSPIVFTHSRPSPSVRPTLGAVAAQTDEILRRWPFVSSLDCLRPSPSRFGACAPSESLCCMRYHCRRSRQECLEHIPPTSSPSLLLTPTFRARQMCDDKHGASPKTSRTLSLSFSSLPISFIPLDSMSRPDTQRSSLSDGKEQPPFYEQGEQVAPRLGDIDESAGVKRIAAIAGQMTPMLRCWMFFGGEWSCAPRFVCSLH